jgi:peptidoglycan/LPS O-acetylase OafA/YrhL
MDTSTAHRPVSYLPNLTPLRGIAALLTVVFHFGIVIGPVIDIFHVGPVLGPLTEHSALIGHLYLMVDFFFILSGFIMCHVYSRLFAGAVTKEAFKKFAIARFARVYPLHFIMLIYTVILFAVSGWLGVPKLPVLQVGNTSYSFVTNLFLLHSMNFNNWFSWDHASWSISTEWWAYMVFPFLAGPFLKLNSAGKAIVFLLCFAGYLAIIQFIVPLTTLPEEISFVRGSGHGRGLDVSYQFGFLRCLCGFILGMVIYQAYRVGWGRRLFGNGFIMVAATLGLFVVMHFGLPDPVSIFFLPFILLSGAYGSPSIDRLFANKGLQKIGDWSFSIYLVHQPLLFTIGNIYTYFHPVSPDDTLTIMSSDSPMLMAWIICLLTIAVALLVSSLVYRFWELPARKWINSKAGKDKTVTATIIS